MDCGLVEMWRWGCCGSGEGVADLLVEVMFEADLVVIMKMERYGGDEGGSCVTCTSQKCRNNLPAAIKVEKKHKNRKHI
jgi:hypothetical protein